MPPNKQSSSKLSSLAADYMNITGDEIWARLHPMGKARDAVQIEACDKLANDIQSIAASVVSQDQTPGQQ